MYHTGVRTRDLQLYRHRLSSQGRNRTYHISIADFHFDDLIVAALAHARSLRQKHIFGGPLVWRLLV